MAIDLQGLPQRAVRVGDSIERARHDDEVGLVGLGPRGVERLRDRVEQQHGLVERRELLGDRAGRRSARWCSLPRRRCRRPAPAVARSRRRPCSPRSTITRCSRSQRNASRSATASASAPAGLCAPSSRIEGWRPTISSRPGDRTSANASRMVSASSGLSINASNATSAAAAFCAACSPNIGRNSSSYVARKPRIRSAWPPVRLEPILELEVAVLQQQLGAHLRASRLDHRERLGVLLAAHHDGCPP